MYRKMLEGGLEISKNKDIGWKYGCKIVCGQVTLFLCFQNFVKDKRMSFLSSHMLRVDIIVD